MSTCNIRDIISIPNLRKTLRFVACTERKLNKLNNKVLDFYTNYHAPLIISSVLSLDPNCSRLHVHKNDSPLALSFFASYIAVESFPGSPRTSSQIISSWNLIQAYKSSHLLVHCFSTSNKVQPACHSFDVLSLLNLGQECKQNVLLLL